MRPLARMQVVMGFLFGIGDEEPLRYRILPISRFMNLGGCRSN